MNTFDRLYIYTLGDRNVHVVGCSGTHMLWWLCLTPKVIERYDACVLWGLNAHVLVCSHALLISCSHVYLLWWSYALSTCLDDHLLLCSYILKFTCFYVHILCWSYTSMFTFFDNRMFLCQHALKRTCSLAYMPYSSIPGHFYDWMLLH